MQLKTFVEPSTQVVVGNLWGDTDLPKEVVNGPSHLFSWRRVYCTVSTKPQWLTFVSKDAATATQIPVMFEFDCNWARNLSGLSSEQLYNAASISNAKLETILQNNLERFARHFVSRRAASELVATPDTYGAMLTTIKRNQTLIVDYVKEEISKRLGGLGLRLNALELTVMLPYRLQRDIETVWQLQQAEAYIPAMAERNFAQAMGQSAPIFNFVSGDFGDELGNGTISTTLMKEMSQQRSRIREGAVPNKSDLQL